MPPIVASSLLIEKNFRRLLNSAEERLKAQAIEDWKLNQFVNSLTNMLNDMRKSMSRPSSKQLEDYKQRIDLLRQQIDPIKLDDQTFPRQQLLQKEATVKEQQPTSTPPPATTTSSPSESEGSPRPPTRAERPHLNRVQQHVLSAEDKQDDIAQTMRVTTRSLKNSAQRVNDIVKNDQKKLVEAENLIDTNTAKLHVQSKRLKQNAYNGSNCWIYLMLIVVIVSFIYLTLFMRMFRKRRVTATTTTSRSSLGAKSSFLDNSINQTSINQTNSSTATPSTDYISLLLNYANDNHTDL